MSNSLHYIAKRPSQRDQDLVNGALQDEHTLFVSWIAGPSAIGSENGTPSSIMSAPPSCMASRIGTVSWGVGYPAVTKVTNAGLSYK